MKRSDQERIAARKELRLARMSVELQPLYP